MIGHKARKAISCATGFHNPASTLSRTPMCVIIILALAFPTALGAPTAARVSERAANDNT